MPRVTKKDLEKKIEDRDKLIDMLYEQIDKLQQENTNILNNKEVVPISEHEGALKEIERIKINLETVKELYTKEKAKNDKFLQENKELKANNTEKHNARGAGRKSTLTQEQLQKIHQLYKEGLSYGAIAKEVGVSKTYAYKLIKEHKDEI